MIFLWKQWKIIKNYKGNVCIIVILYMIYNLFYMHTTFHKCEYKMFFLYKFIFLFSKDALHQQSDVKHIYSVTKVFYFK